MPPDYCRVPVTAITQPGRHPAGAILPWQCPAGGAAGSRARGTPALAGAGSRSRRRSEPTATIDKQARAFNNARKSDSDSRRAWAPLSESSRSRRETRARAQTPSARPGAPMRTRGPQSALPPPPPPPPLAAALGRNAVAAWPTVQRRSKPGGRASALQCSPWVPRGRASYGGSGQPAASESYGGSGLSAPPLRGAGPVGAARARIPPRRSAARG